MSPICARCGLYFKPEKNGLYFEETRPLRDGGRGPYKLWSGDLWKCHGCGAEVIAGVGQRPIAEHYQPDYQHWIEACPPQVRVN